MKNTLLLILTFLNLILYSQNSMNEQMNKLFLNLDINSDPKSMITKSHLKFQHIVRKGISWNGTGGNISNFVTNFDTNSLIKSQIKNGQISILQKDEEVQSGSFSINERIWFYSEEDMITEYYNIVGLFENYGYRIKNSIVQNENNETKFEFTDILIENNTKKSKLTISYSIPCPELEDKEYFLSFIYAI